MTKGGIRLWRFLSRVVMNFGMLLSRLGILDMLFLLQVKPLTIKIHLR